MIKQYHHAHVAATAALALSGSAFADHHSGTGEGLVGVATVVTNTFRAESGGVEMDVAAFGFMNNVFAKVDEGVEFPTF